MERRADGAKNAMQCLWGSLPVWPSPSRVSPCCQPYIYSIIALQLSQESCRDEKEGYACDHCSYSGHIIAISARILILIAICLTIRKRCSICGRELPLSSLLVCHSVPVYLFFVHNVH
uniref:Uncharacterized protein n=1 Tax=Rhizophora mucronata TaxID=61149 RepID=A0A2P2LDN5_RHIMU